MRHDTPRLRGASVFEGDMIPGALHIGTTRQLFLDDRVVERASNVRRRLHRPVRHPANPVVRADRAWEQGGSGVDVTGGTVLFDSEEGRFKMWYRTNQAILETDPDGTQREAAGAAYVSCYAVSQDGVSWEKPQLDLVEFHGRRDNNMLPPASGGRGFIRRPNLIKDYDEADPERRYKMVYLDEIGGRFALVPAYSGDGIHWRMDPAPPAFFERPVIPNGILFGWDPNRSEYVLYHRNAGQEPADVDGRAVRSDLRRLVRSASRDFETWRETAVALELGAGDPDDLDVGHLGILSGVLYAGDQYVGFLDTATARAVEDVPAELWEPIYKMDHAEHRQELVVSRDGMRWTRALPHWECIRPGLPGAWDSNHVIPSKPITRGDRIYIYYSGNCRSCKSYLPGSPDAASSSYAIGLATLRLDGFASIEAYTPGGWLETRPLMFEGDRLVINARAPREPFRASGQGDVVFEGDRTFIRPRAHEAPAPRQAEPFGAVRVELTNAAGSPLGGLGAADCDPFTGDSTRHVVTWSGNADVGRAAGQPVRVKFYLTQAALYSFEFAGAAARPRADPACPGCRGAPRT